LELGIYSFADTGYDHRTGRTIDAKTRLQNLLEEIQLADSVGLDVFGVGEHHRADYAVPSPAVILAAAAGKTRRIRLTSAVTVLGSADPIRVFQEFSMLDLISDGRAEIMAGRGAFTESFPLFGYKLADYETLFEEKLEILLLAQQDADIRWSGMHREELRSGPVQPRPVQRPLPIWLGVGGTPESAVRAGVLGLPMALAIIGGRPESFAPIVDLYRQASRGEGRDPGTEKVAITSHGFVGASLNEAIEAFYPYYAELMSARFQERGWPPVTRSNFNFLASTEGAMIIGSPREVADKILREYRIFRHDRFLLQPSMGTLPHGQTLSAIERFGKEVAPLVRAALSDRNTTTKAISL
jgi:probable LLM family oxidoreductase